MVDSNKVTVFATMEENINVSSPKRKSVLSYNSKASPKVIQTLHGTISSEAK